MIINLKEECGGTETSKNNLDEILANGWLPVRLVVGIDYEGSHYVELFITRNNLTEFHRFTGFSFGYLGEGCHGLLYLAKRIGLHELSNMDSISSLKIATTIEYRYNDNLGAWQRKGEWNHNGRLGRRE